MRLEHSIKNSATVLISQLVSMALGFATRTVFIYTLTQEYLGLNGLFTSFLSLLSLSELGIGSAITYALYKPLATKDEAAVSALMNFYAKAYKIIGLIISVLGVLAYPFVGIFVGEVPQVENIHIIYLMFLFNTSLSYFFSYKRSLITADQQDWICVINQSAFLILQNILQILLLVFTGNYLLYLTAQLICTFISNLVISRRADRMYPYLRENRHLKVPEGEMKKIRVNIGAMLMHQIGSVLVTGTDNMMVAWVDLTLLARYSNYSLVTQMISTVLRQVFSAITASVGNLIATENKEHQALMYNRIWFVNFWMYGFFAVAMAVMLEPFVIAWASREYLLSPLTTVLIVLNFYLMGMRQTNIAYVNTAGLFKPLRFKSIIEAAINLVSSLYFLVVMDMGINGVFIGTLISTLTTNFWWEAYIVIKRYLNVSLARYFARYGLYTALGLVSYFASKALCGLIELEGWAGFIAKGFTCTLSINLIFALFLCRTDGARYIFGKLLAMIMRRLSANKAK